MLSCAQTRAVVIAALTTAAGSATAQCTPHWDGAISRANPISGFSPYVQPMVPWNDGTGETLYVGGSFPALGPAAYIAKYNQSSNTFSRLGSGVSGGFTNAFMTSMTPYTYAGSEKLICGGFYATAGNVPNTASLAAWDGTNWRAMGTGWDPNNRFAIQCMTVWNGKLYLGGNFTSIGGVTASGICTWDGTTYAPVGSGMGGGFSPNVFCMKLFNDGSGEKLYVGGRFSSIGGIPGLVARWTGSAWEAVGTGLTTSSTFGDLEAMAVFDSDGDGPARPALYAGGWDPRPPSGATSSVCKWDGASDVWVNVGQPMGGRTTSLIGFDDGTGPAIYCGGTAQPGINYIARLVGNTWTTIDGGVTGSSVDGGFPSVFGLAVWQNTLYVGGNFTMMGTETCSGIATRNSCLSDECAADFNGDNQVDFFDYLDFAQAFNDESPAADFNGDNQIDFFDYLDFAQAFDAGCD
jgi:hypothetical protein